MTAKILSLQKQTDTPVRDWIRVSHNLVLHVPSGTYYVRKSKAGRGELFKTTGYDKKGPAQTKADEMVSEWLGGRLKLGRRLRVEQFIPEVEEQLKQEFQNGDREEGTRQSDRAYLKAIKKYFGVYFIDEIDEEFWANWVRANSKTAGRTTLFDVAKYLSLTLTRAHRAGLINRKPKIKNPDRPKTDTMHKLVSPAEIQAIARCLVKQENEWLLLQLFMGAECGNRTGEVRKLRWDMIEFDMDDQDKPMAIIRFRVDKAGRARGKGREFYASERVAQMLWKRYGKRNQNSPFVFASEKNAQRFQTAMHQNRKWRETLVSAGITRPIWFYWLRHTFYTTALLDAGLPIQHVSEFGGTSIQTLQKTYLHSDAKRTKAVASALRIDLGSDTGREKTVKETGNDNENA
jgi:integrase